MANGKQRTGEGELEARLRKAHQLVEVGAHYVHYRDHKNPYIVLSIGLLEGTEEPCVIYQKLSGSEFLKEVVWIRPVSIWVEQVAHEGKMVSRFHKVRSAASSHPPR